MNVARREYVVQELQKKDFLSSVDPKSVALKAGLAWLKKLIFIAVWPLVKPWISQHINEKIADGIEDILEGL